MKINNFANFTNSLIMIPFKKLFYFSFLILLFSSGSAFSQWQWQNPLPQGNILFGSNYLNTNTGWACGDGGTIIKTTNAGNNWVVTSTFTKNSIRSIFFLNENTGYACGLNGTVLNSTDGGLKWSKILLNTTGNLFCIKFSGSTGFISGDTGIVFKSTNSGLNWSRKTTNVTRTLTSIAVQNSLVIAAGLNGTVIRSTDTGETFQTVNPS
ncbi:MAG: YCF48-related protein, partial [Ignavibacteria bacterium]